MTLPKEYALTFLPLKYFLTCYRALSDAAEAVRSLDDLLAQPSLRFSDWKVKWVAACVLLRTSVDVMKVDARSCLDERLREAFRKEWCLIKEDKEKHRLYWDFIKCERDNIIHEYRWEAYELLLDGEGNKLAQPPTLLGVSSHEYRTMLPMRSGPFAGTDSLRLLHQACDWVEERILHAVQGAGFSLEELRSVGTFEPMPRPRETILTAVGRVCDEP